MVLEKDKIYKIIHKFHSNTGFLRNYIICSPKQDVIVEEGTVTFETHFTICFNKRVITHKLLKGGALDYTQSSSTSVNKSNILEELNNKDINEIRTAVGMLEGKYKYNRRLNRLIEIKNDN